MDIFTEPWNFVLFQKSCEWSRIQSVNATTILEVLIGNQLLNMPFVNVHPMSLLWNVLILSPSIIPQCSICNNFPSCVEDPKSWSTQSAVDVFRTCCVSHLDFLQPPFHLISCYVEIGVSGWWLQLMLMGEGVRAVMTYCHCLSACVFGKYIYT